MDMLVAHLRTKDSEYIFVFIMCLAIAFFLVVPIVLQWLFNQLGPKQQIERELTLGERVDMEVAMEKAHAHESGYTDGAKDGYADGYRDGYSNGVTSA